MAEFEEDVLYRTATIRDARGLVEGFQRAKKYLLERNLTQPHWPDEAVLRAWPLAYPLQLRMAELKINGGRIGRLTAITQTNDVVWQLPRCA